MKQKKNKQKDLRKRKHLLIFLILTNINLCILTGKEITINAQWDNISALEVSVIP